MALLTKEQILAVEDRRFVTVDVPEWGGEVRIGTMSALQRDRRDVALVRYRNEGGEDAIGVRALVLAMCIVDDKGSPIFSPADVEALAAKDGEVIDRLIAVAADLNKLRKTDAEELRGN